VSATSLLSATPVEQEPGAATCRAARSIGDLAWHFAIRRTVFVDEQGLFPSGAEGDLDERDDDPATIHAIGGADGLISGAVRLYPLDSNGLWKGDRLAVLPAFRHGLLGARLVRFAVATAGELGGARMMAMIQLPNVQFFESLGWVPAGDVAPYHGVDHQPMSIPLSRQDP
jgi:putative N-acetyltransferase (TIGR04045 family)